MRICKNIVALLLLSAFSSIALCQIDNEALYKTVKFLASKELAGRVAGSQGYAKASSYMADQFAVLKLKPGGDEKYFQPFNIEYNEILPPEHLSVLKEGITINYKLGTDYIYRGFTGAGSFTSPVVFCGYGIDQPELGYSDYTGVDVHDKVVMVFRYNPKWNIGGKPFINGNPREKAIVATKHGAIGILFVSTPNDSEPQHPIGSVINGKGEQMTGFPEIHIGLNVVSDLLEGTGYSIGELETKIDNSKRPFSVPINNMIELEVHTRYQKEKKVSNVVGILEGSDPLLKNKFIVLGAHLDHVGSQAGKIYFPGANDNASGSAALLQIAQAFVHSKEKPRFSIAFVFFAGEEQGLNGSKYFVDHLPPQIHDIQYMLNFDCIGYGDSMQVNGGKSFPDLWNVVKKIDLENDKMLTNETGEGGGADADPFFKKGIQTLYFASTNSYKHLHLPTDTPETLNKELLFAFTRLGYKVAKKLSSVPPLTN
jgi:hypothetical protein